MNDDFLKAKLRRVIRRCQWLGFWRRLAACWAVAALVGVGVVWLQGGTGWASPLALPLLAAIAAGGVTAIGMLHFATTPDYRWIAQKIEQAHPELKGLLLTAVQQNLEPGAEQGFLQYRVLQEATARSQEQDWTKVVPTRRLAVVQAMHLAALGCFAFVLFNLRPAAVEHRTEGVRIGPDGIAVTPGDTSIEKGESLVVLARFGRTLPSNVNLVVRASGTTPQTIPLVKSLADPVFGGSVPEVASDLTYRIEYRGQHTRDFKVTVFEHPRLVRSDADLAFPAYTKLPVKHIEDTRRVSAVEGTKLGLSLQLNKPVASAALVAHDAAKTVIPLTVAPGKAVATLPAMPLVATQTYDLKLVDADGRANKVAAPFVIDVQPNRPPELRLNSPRGDVRPSALEEVTFDGTVFDDFGSPAYGLAYTTAGGETKFIELGHDTAAKEKRAFNHLVKLEDLGVKPDDLISWYLWADDIGPDGKLRRTSGDLSFAEVRPFDEVFREAQGMQPQDQQQQQQQQGQGNSTRKLTDLEKQIINATWRLQRDGATPKYADDSTVVHDSQQQALDQAQEAMGNARSPRDAALWDAATKQMEQALEKLKDAAKTPAPLAQALPAEQSAYQSLLKLQARETNVARGRNQRGGGGQGQQASQRQIDQLDLTQAQNRYETQRQAQAPQSPERKEQLQVMNRLQELARRQQDLNDRLKELQTSLQEAKTEQEREDLKRRLKRLEEEQRQMLADADEVQQRMDRPENQANMSQQRQQLDQTRQDIQRAADAASQGSVAQALAAGTRAQRSLQQIRDDLRKENSSQFADDLREMRSEARDLANQQADIGQKLDALGNGTQRKTLTDTGDRKELLDQLAQQKERMNKLVDRAEQVSEQAENIEPLLSRQLYDSIRKLSTDDTNTIKQAKQDLINNGIIRPDIFDQLDQTAQQDGGGKALDLTRTMLNEGYLPQAGQAGQRARGEIDELKRGVERAADSVLGDDAEQLKLAQSELDQLTDQLQRELAQAQGQAPAGGDKASQQAGQPGQTGQRGDQQQPGAQPGNSNQPAPGEATADGSEPGQQPGRGGQQPGQRPGGGGQQPGQQPGQGERGLANADEQNAQGGRGGQQPGQQQPGGAQAGGAQPGEAQANADNPRDANGQPRDNAQPGQARGGRQQLAGGRGGRNGQQNGGNRGGFNVDNFLNGGGVDTGGVYNGGAQLGDRAGGPIAGDNFGPWTDRLRNVEELLDSPDLRDAVANARERARLVRRDAAQNRTKPDWTVVQLQILKPLVEVRSRVAEELARRDPKDSLAPIDRDPVPNRFADSVRRYYEELGKDEAKAEAVR